MKELMQFNAQVLKVETRVDGTIKITMETQELAPEDKTRLFSFGQNLIFAALCEHEIKREDLSVPEPATEFRSDKSPSQRLRAVFYCLWEEGYKARFPSFDDFYKMQMQKLIDQVKERLH
jgi:hypothetical protein